MRGDETRELASLQDAAGAPPKFFQKSAPADSSFSESVTLREAALADRRDACPTPFSLGH
ncbi:MAG: hypothetical protein KME26_15095 [Oscillatoria princeps RMCB-10]|nr:hypothetical protein [Oscillatoria princeps RMCB-10]